MYCTHFYVFVAFLQLKAIFWLLLSVTCCIQSGSCTVEGLYIGAVAVLWNDCKIGTVAVLWIDCDLCTAALQPSDLKVSTEAVQFNEYDFHSYNFHFFAVGQSAAGLPLSLLASDFQWAGVLMFLEVVCACVLVLLLLTRTYSPRLQLPNKVD